MVVFHDCQECSTKIAAKSGKVFLRHLEPSRAKFVIIKCNLSVEDQGGRFVCMSRMFHKILSRIREGHGRWVVNMSPPMEATSAPQTRVTRSSDIELLPI